MDAPETGELTGVLAAVRRGDPDAEGLLAARVYDELRLMARRQLRREHARPTLFQTTMLVHEAWLRLAGNSRTAWKDRQYFFGAAARAMRRVLVDHARRRDAAKRGHRGLEVTLSGDVPDPAQVYDVLELHDALERLAGIRPRVARVVELRFFGGLSVAETAHGLGVSPRSVDSDWNFARRWLERALSGTAGRAEGVAEPDAT